MLVFFFLLHYRFCTFAVKLRNHISPTGYKTEKDKLFSYNLTSFRLSLRSLYFVKMSSFLRHTNSRSCFTKKQQLRRLPAFKRPRDKKTFWFIVARCLSPSLPYTLPQKSTLFVNNRLLKPHKTCAFQIPRRNIYLLFFHHIIKTL